MSLRYGTLAAALLAPAFLVAPALGQDEVPMKLVFAAGQELPYSFAMNVNITQKMGEVPEGQQSIDSVSCHAMTKIKINEVGGDGSLKATVTFDKAMVRAQLGSDERGFEWPNPLPLPDSASVEQKLGNVLSGAKIAVDVDPKGQVTISGGFEEFAEAFAKMENPDQRVMGFFDPAAFADIIEPVFRLDDAPAAPRAIDKGWQTNHSVDMPPVGVMAFITDWSVMNVETDVVRYVGKSTINVLQPENKPEDVPSVTLKPESSAAVESFYDRNKGLLRRRKSSNAIFTTWVLGPMTLEQGQSGSVTTVLLDENVNMKLDPNRKF